MPVLGNASRLHWAKFQESATELVLNLLTLEREDRYSGFLVKGLKTGDQLRFYASEIRTAGERAASLTKQLLAFFLIAVIASRNVQPPSSASASAADQPTRSCPSCDP